MLQQARTLIILGAAIRQLLTPWQPEKAALEWQRYKLAGIRYWWLGQGTHTIIYVIVSHGPCSIIDHPRLPHIKLALLMNACLINNLIGFAILAK